MTETVNLYVEERGSGTPVVLLHGFPFTHAIWDAQIAALSASYRVIAPDLRGHGQSPPDGDVYPMETLAADVAAVLDEHDIDRAVWVGHSMGGYITMAALRTMPERVAAAGFVATHPHADPPEKRIQRVQSADKALMGAANEILLGMMAVLFAPSLDRRSATAQRVYELMQQTKTKALSAALRGMAERPSSVETLKQIKVPALVIAGEADQIVDLDQAREMAYLLPEAAFHHIPDAGHMVMVEQPDATTQALHTFLNDLPKR